MQPEAKRVHGAADLERAQSRLAVGELASVLSRPPLADSLEKADRPLRSLLQLAPTDPVAARLVLRAILPSLEQQARWITCSRAHLSAGREGYDEVWELLCLEAWETICSGFVSPARLVFPQLLGEILSRTLRALAPGGAPRRDETSAGPATGEPPPLRHVTRAELPAPATRPGQARERRAAT